MQILGIDIGGSGIKGAPVDLACGRLATERVRISTPQPATPTAVVGTIKELVSQFNWQGAVGIGFPAAIKQETVMTAANIDSSWIGTSASTYMSQEVGCPIHLINDVDAAGYCEMAFGAGKDHKGVVIVVAAGTGIGTAIFTNGTLLPNTELGHLRMYGDSAEKYASNATRKNAGISVEEWAARFGEYMRYVEGLFWPDLFILGGGISKKFDDFVHALNIKTPVVAAQHQNNAGIVGAALAAKDAGFGL